MIKIRYFLTVFLLFYLLLTLTFIGSAQETEEQIRLSLEDCISLALKSNLSLNIQRISPEIQESLLAIAKGNFDPSISIGPTLSKSNDPPSGTSPNLASSRNGNSLGFNVGFSDPIITGGRYGISFSSNRFDSDLVSSQILNPSYRSGLTFSISQPLLKGSGINLNKSYIYIAKNNKDMSILRLKSLLIKTLSDVQNAYWELIFAQENLKVQQLSLKQAQDLLVLNQRFKDIGKATTSDVLQAQSAVASREVDVISAMDLIKDSEDKLKRITNIIQDESKWDTRIMLVDVPPFEEINVSLEESIDIAIKNRPEYIQAQLDLKNSDLSIALAKNQKLPNIDLEGTFSLNGYGNSRDSFSQVGNAKYGSWTTGLALKMPLGDKVSKGNERKALLEKDQKVITLKDLEQQIVGEVRSSIRQIDTNKKRISSTKTAEDFAKQVLATEEKKYSVGLSTSYQLLQFQANQAIATKNYLRAEIDYRKSVVNLYQSLGITLDKLNIKLEEERR